jgi:hypothetical protein
MISRARARARILGFGRFVVAEGTGRGRVRLVIRFAAISLLGLVGCASSPASREREEPAPSASTVPPAPPDGRPFACIAQEVTCRVVALPSPDAQQLARDQCGKIGRIADTCPTEGRVARCSDARAPDGSTVAEILFFRVPEDEAKTREVIDNGKKVCDKSGGTFSTETP